MLYAFEIHTFKKDFGLYCNLKLHSLGLLQLESEKEKKTKQNTPETTERNRRKNGTRGLKKKGIVAQH